MIKQILWICGLLILFAKPAFAQTTGNLGDVDRDFKVGIADFNEVLGYFGTSQTNPYLDSDLDHSGRVWIEDFNEVVGNFGNVYPTPTAVPSPTPTSTPVPPSATPTAAPLSTPTPTPIGAVQEWTQFGHDAQKTGWTPQSVATPWKYKWQWNGAGADGKRQAGHLSVARNVQPITGGGRIYMIAADTVYAFDKNNGSALWTRGGIGSLTSTPAYYNGNIFIASNNNNLYKLNATTGAIISQYTAAAPLRDSVLQNGNFIYTVSTAGILYKIDSSTMAKVWEYAGGSPGATSVSYSSSRNILVYVTQDLFVHAVNNNDGIRKWRVKPTQRTYSTASTTSDYTEALNGWPVIAEQHGLVFIRYRLEWDTLWAWSPYPTTNAQIKTNLTNQPNQQVVFPLSLDTGAQSFVAAVGNGGAGDGGNLPMGTQPVVRTVGGQEVAYIIWRNGQTCATGWCDGREDATMGEMVLDNTTVSGYTAGDVRFVRFIDIQTDEMMNITMSNDIIFHSHWLINAAEKVTDRSASRGSTYTNPIVTTDAPFVIWRQVYCPPTNTQCNPLNYPGGTGFTYGPSNCPFDAVHRYCSAGLYSYGDQRAYPAGFYEYHNDSNSGSTPFTIVSDGLVLVKTNDGAIIALENGNPTAFVQSQKKLAANSTNKSTSTVLGSSTPIKIYYKDALKYIGQNVEVEGVIASAVNNRPKAIYLGFKNPHDGALLVRIFEKDLGKFSYNPISLKGKKVLIKGYVSLYWPEGKDPEIRVSDSTQIEIIQ